MVRAFLSFSVLIVAMWLTSCGANSSVDCSNLPLKVSPANATASVSATQPGGNQVQFSATLGAVPQGCAIPTTNLVQAPLWTSSDTTEVQFSGASNGLATCVGATNGAVTVTATQKFGSDTATGTTQLTCQ